MTVEFKSVESGQISGNPSSDSPPLLSEDLLGNFPVDDYPDKPLCTECEDWNREWELFFIPEFGNLNQKPGDGSEVFTFALGQTRDGGVGSGFSVEARVYDIPFAGDACFPCADVNDDTGMVLTVNCLDDATVTASLDVTIKGCAHATWSWDRYRPSIFNIDRTHGAAKRASFLTGNFISGWSGDTGAACRTPAGLCKTEPCFGDVEEGCQFFPCFKFFDETIPETGDDVATFYDRTNCYWSNVSRDEDETSSSTSTMSSSTLSTSSSMNDSSRSSFTSESTFSSEGDDDDKPCLRFFQCEAAIPDELKNPIDCEICKNNQDILDSKEDFFPIQNTVEAIEPYDQEATAVNDHVLRLTGSEAVAGAISSPATTGVCADLGAGFQAGQDSAGTICNYILYIRYGNSNRPSEEPNLVFYTTDPGSGPPVDLGSADRSTPLFLEPGTQSLDGDHNTIALNGILYREAFGFEMACDAVYKIEFSGPRFGSIDFDSVVLRRI